MHCLAILSPFFRQSRTFLASLVGLPPVAWFAPDQKRWLTAKTPRHWSGFLRRFAAASAHCDRNGLWFSSKTRLHYIRNYGIKFEGLQERLLYLFCIVILYFVSQNPDMSFNFKVRHWVHYWNLSYWNLFY